MKRLAMVAATCFLGLLLTACDNQNSTKPEDANKADTTVVTPPDSKTTVVAPGDTTTTTTTAPAATEKKEGDVQP